MIILNVKWDLFIFIQSVSTKLTPWSRLRVIHLSKYPSYLLNIQHCCLSWGWVWGAPVLIPALAPISQERRLENFNNTHKNIHFVPNLSAAMTWFPMTGSSCELGCRLDSQQPGSRNCPRLAQVFEDVSRNHVLSTQLRMLCQWAPLTPQVCSPGSPHFRASLLNGYFSQNSWCPARTGILNFQSGASLGTSGPGMESSQQALKRFAVGFTMHGCLEEAFRLMQESQKGCHWDKDL